MAAKETPMTRQMKLSLVNSEPISLPPDKQQELARALADLLWNAAVAASFEPEEEDPR
ncbi:MAG: hypothetical protein JO108_10320 [Acidobacteriaceae bacterium]|nr:hypothetical protein [Acidobacteriaceae bacterium]